MAEAWIDTVWRDSLALQAGERVLILADRPLWAAASALAEAAGALGSGNVEQIALPDPGVTFHLVPRGLAAAVRAADVLVSLWSGLNLAVEDASMRAAMDAFRQAGRGRWASLAQMDGPTLSAVLGQGLDEVARRTEEMAGRMRSAGGAHLTSERGTDLVLSYAGRPVHAETGRIRESGEVGNLPAGEVYVAPHETRADGRLVVDVALGDLWLDEPVSLTFERGRVVGVAGGRAAAELRSRLGTDAWAWTIGEFGLGCNPHLSPCRKVALAEKALGTAHVALGSNRAFGGRNPAATHYDCVIAAPTVRFQE